LRQITSIDLFPDIARLPLAENSLKELPERLSGAMKEARQSLRSYSTFYNQSRFHQTLARLKPNMVYFGKPKVKLAA